jgi:hypothetical protein
MIPASRNGVAAWLVESWRATNTPSEPHTSTSTSGHTTMSNHRCGLRHNTMK